LAGWSFSTIAADALRSTRSELDSLTICELDDAAALIAFADDPEVDVAGMAIGERRGDAGHYPERTEMMYWRNCRLRVVVADLLESVGRHYRTSLGKRRQLQSKITVMKEPLPEFDRYYKNVLDCRGAWYK
jgi:hypothetical protein